MVKDARNILKLNENLGRISQDIVYEKLSTGFALPNLSEIKRTNRAMTSVLWTRNFRCGVCRDNDLGPPEPQLIASASALPGVFRLNLAFSLGRANLPKWV